MPSEVHLSGGGTKSCTAQSGGDQSARAQMSSREDWMSVEEKGLREKYDMNHEEERIIRGAGRGKSRRRSETKAEKFRSQGHMRPKKAQLKKKSQTDGRTQPLIALLQNRN